MRDEFLYWPFTIFDFCPACAAEIACQELAFEETRYAFSTNCNGCGQRLHHGRIGFRTSTARTALNFEQLVQVLISCRRIAEERRGSKPVGLFARDNGRVE